jgi:3-hydroxyisobutyrate dehydrogenase-like beta-hydroxyacid dehydrogenase
VTISGSTPVAKQGALTLFGGGDQGCFTAAESIFRVIAKKYFYLGPSGSGAAMKLVVNSLLGIGMQAIAEAVALGEKAGLDRTRLLGVLSETAVVAPAHVGRLDRALKNDYSPQFPLRLMNKDFGLILNLAAAVGAVARDTGGLRGQCRTIGARTGARFLGSDSGDGKASSFEYRQQWDDSLRHRFCRKVDPVARKQPAVSERWHSVK